MAPENATLAVVINASANTIPPSSRSAESYDSGTVKVSASALVPEVDTDRKLKEQIVLTGERYKSLATQFGTFVIISTFAVALIVSFLSFAFTVIVPKDPSRDNQAFDIGMLLAFIASGCHFGIIIVGGRATALCFRMATLPISEIDSEVAIPEDPVHTEFGRTLRSVDFTRYVTYCERLLLLGTFFLIASMLFLAFYVFSQLAYPVVLTGLSIVGVFTVYRTGFWSVSILKENITRAVFRRQQRHEDITKKQTTRGQPPHIVVDGTEQHLGGDDG